MTDLSERLIKARSERGWSQQDLANSSGIAPAQISRYEVGSNRPRSVVVMRLAKALGVSYEWLQDGDGSRSESDGAKNKTKRITKSRTRELPPFGQSLPPDLGEKIEYAARDAGRNINAEIILRLEESFKPRPPLTEVELDRIADKIYERMYRRRTDEQT